MASANASGESSSPHDPAPPDGSAGRALLRLRDPQHPALRSLAELLIDEAIRRPVGELLHPSEIAAPLARAIHEAAASTTLRDGALQHLASLREHATARSGSLGDHLAPEVRSALSVLLAMPVSPSADVAYKLLNHEALRVLLREVLHATLSRFVAGMRAVDQGALGGLAGRVARRGRGFLGAAEGIVGAVRGEVEAALEGRTREFLSGGVDEAVRGVAAWLADPAHAELAASMRVGMFNVIVDLPLAQLLSEADELSTEEVVDAVLDAVRALAARPTLEADLTRAIEEATAPWSDVVASEVLTDLGLRDAARLTGTAALEPLLREATQTSAFDAWWRELHA